MKRYETAANKVESLIELLESAGVISSTEAETLRTDDVAHSRDVAAAARDGRELPTPPANANANKGRNN